MSQFFDPTGYNKADQQFRERDRESVRNLRQLLDERRQKSVDEQAKKLHWMKCPKCGGDMHEVEYENAKLDQCKSCGGVYFDPGELGILVGHRQRGPAFLHHLFSWLPRWAEYSPMFMTGLKK